GRIRIAVAADGHLALDGAGAASITRRGIDGPVVTLLAGIDDTVAARRAVARRVAKRLRRIVARERRIIGRITSLADVDVDDAVAARHRGETVGAAQRHGGVVAGPRWIVRRIADLGALHPWRRRLGW